MKIIIASGNSNKISEINSILGQVPKLKLNIAPLPSNKIPEPYEPFDTCLENAKHKAKHYANFTGSNVLSEDAGLYIEALDGFPGVRTKNFVLESNGLNNAFKRLEQMLSGKPSTEAYFICAAAIYNPETNQMVSFEAKCPGRISFPARGAEGFGFDSVFIPEGHDKTMAELGIDLKNKIGHRAQAILGLIKQL